MRQCSLGDLLAPGGNRSCAIRMPVPGSMDHGHSRGLALPSGLLENGVSKHRTSNIVTGSLIHSQGLARRTPCFHSGSFRATSLATQSLRLAYPRPSGHSTPSRVSFRSADPKGPWLGAISNHISTIFIDVRYKAPRCPRII